VHADQHQVAEGKLFLMRVEWSIDGFSLDLGEFSRRFGPLADRFEMRWRLEDCRKPLRVALFVSKYDHCLMDLLYRHKTGELLCDIPLIVGNHEDARRWGDFYGVPFHYIPTPPGAKEEFERSQLDLLAAEKIDLVVMARYMQILSREFVTRYPHRIINVHHSFLPAFVGAKPYHRAFERGVKLIGATSHYATEDLDEGPIIEQDVVRISHRDGLDDLLEAGRDLEKIVLSRAVRWHLDHRVLVYDRKTVIFD
ncbi:MAG: formyltetrahydrofolate deformylase, partial [Gemmataceae bacterium]|nr:formyltetrahydrofolate deformylase [Gemmataceae bacterium]